MDFENDIFISYSHIDNQPLTEGEKGWISDFHRTLEIRLGELLGESPKIWRDPRLSGNDYFSDVIRQQLLKVALLVSVLSPRYLRSEWCQKELQTFFEAAEQTGGLHIANKSRILKVVKTYIPLEEQPPELQPLLGYEFYQLDKETGIPFDFNMILGREARERYYSKLFELAHDIRQLLIMMRKSKENSSDMLLPSLTNKIIYLAATTYDLYDERDKLKHELQQRGHVVLPDQSLPLSSPDFEKVVCENLERSTLSIHLIGRRYGMIPEAADQSVVGLQYELAEAYHQQNSSFSHLIWMPLGLQAQEPRQQEFIQSLQNAPELLQTTLEELKTIIQDKLNSKPKPLVEIPTEEELIQLYLICDQCDLERIEPLYSHFSDQGLDVILPSFEGDETETREEHQKNLRLCNAVIIYYGSVNELWLRVKLRDLQKAAGYGRLEPMLAQAIYIDEPWTTQKQRFQTREALVLDSSSQTLEDSLKPFLNQIFQSKEGQSDGHSSISFNKSFSRSASV